MITFGIITPKSRYDAITLADEIEKRGDGDWDWVLYELNKSYHAVILGTLTMRGRVSRMKGVETTTVGEVIDSSEDNRAEWLIPRARGGVSPHQLAGRKIADFINIAYRAAQPKEASAKGSGSTPEPIERKVVTPRRRAYTGSIPAHAEHVAPPAAARTSSGSSAEGSKPDIARKSRRQKS